MKKKIGIFVDFFTIHDYSIKWYSIRIGEVRAFLESEKRGTADYC